MLMILSFISDIIAWFSSQGGMIFIGTIAVTVISRSAIKIYNLGRMSRVELVTRQDFDRLQESLSRSLRAQRKDIQEHIWELCKTQIDTELKEVSDIKRMHEEAKVISAKMEKEMELLSDKYAEMDSLRDEVRALTNRLNRYEFNENNSDESARRSDD